MILACSRKRSRTTKLVFRKEHLPISPIIPAVLGKPQHQTKKTYTHTLSLSLSHLAKKLQKNAEIGTYDLENTLTVFSLERIPRLNMTDTPNTWTLNPRSPS